MIKLLSITKNENEKPKATIRLGNCEFPATLDIRNRGASFTIEFSQTYHFMSLSQVVDKRYDDHVTIDWGRHRKCVAIENDFPWDEESRRIIRLAASEDANRKFDEHVRKTGLLELYKIYKKQGAKLIARDFIRSESYRSTPPYLEFKDHEHKISWSLKDKKIVFTEQRRRDSGRYRARYDHVVLSGNTVAKFMKKFDRYLLNQFLGINKNDENDES